MKLVCVFLFSLLFNFASYAQPMWSPEVRSQREMQWMKDSLHISPEQADKITPLSLSYQQEMDKAGHLPDKTKKQASLGRKKDAQLKAILNKEQYQKYYKKEQIIRKQAKIIYKDHQPL